MTSFRGPDGPDLEATVKRAAEAVAGLFDAAPVAGLILGSGLGTFAERLNRAGEVSFDELEGFPAATALGHRGAFVVGAMGGRTVIAISGRLHRYEGYSAEQIVLPVCVLGQLGVPHLIVSNAAGGLDPGFRAGELMMIDSCLDLMRCSPPSATGPDPSERTGSGVRPDFDPGLRAAVLEVARNASVPLRRGTYAGLTGPTYETRAEYRFLRRIGAHAVGMSTIPEVQMAGRLGMRTLGLSVITNVANPDAPRATSGDEVIAAAAGAERQMSELVGGLLRHPALDSAAGQPEW